jgi:opacity protein-like surface antigen
MTNSTVFSLGACTMKRFLMTAAMSLVAASTAMAEDQQPGWNVGAAALLGDYRFDSGDVSDTGAGLKLFAGYRFSEWFGVEAAYHNTGDFKEDITPAEAGGNAEVSLDGFSLAGLVFLPIPVEDVEFFAKAGFYNFDQELAVDDEFDQVNSPDGLMAGIGARFAVGEQFGIRFEADWFDIDDGELWSMNLGAEYLFGGSR